ncbi:MAG: GyrI-like domain-containing protein [Terracidiphilus sp.]|jgi:effector-binding domain-containing protein
MNLTEEPEIVQRPESHYVFIERTGPFMKIAPQAWQELHQLKFLISERNKVVGAMALYKMPNIYRAGFVLAGAPEGLPKEVQYERFEGGQYSRFVLTGPYSDLPQASGRVWEIVSRRNMFVRDEFAIENYANDPMNTPEDKLITEILIPTA